jgi:tetratricopeptide (TPR) repeat protein
MFEKVLGYLNEADSYVAIEFLERQEDPREVLQVYNQLLKHFYYEKKNIQSVIVLGRAGAQFGLAASNAAEENDPELANELKEEARAVLYNLASYTWPGWNEQDIEIDENEIAQGLDAAKATFRLAQALNMPALRISRSHWMLGALQLASGNLEAAKRHFDEASNLALEAGEPAEALLSDGFGMLVIQMASPGDYDAQAQLDEVKNKLSGMEDGQYFVEQLNTAVKVFAR